MSKNISIEQSLSAYRIIHTPSNLSWKQHYVNQKFTDINLLKCPREERQLFGKRLDESFVTICGNIRSKTGDRSSMRLLMETIVNNSFSKTNKIDRRVVYSTSNGERPIGSTAFILWNGFQVIDMDIKNEDIANKLKQEIFNKLSKYNWFLAVIKSSSCNGLHIYTKIQIPENEETDPLKKRLLYLTNFRHKYSFVYLACLKLINELGYSEDDLLKWMDLAMFKPQQGAFIPYDPSPLINTSFFEDFIYVDFDDVTDLGHPNVDWVTYPPLKEVFSRWEYFSKDEHTETPINVESAPDFIIGTISNKTHYKHFERWRLANTLVQLYGIEKGYMYLRMICSNNISDKELQGDCTTANRHKKPIDIWAVNRLNSQHGFKIKINIPQEEVDINSLYNSIDAISNPTLIMKSTNEKTFHLNSKQYLSHIKTKLIKEFTRITLIESGAGTGKTEMVKGLVKDGKKVIMIMPFTSTIKAKVEDVQDWSYSYGNKKVKFDGTPGLAMTVDKFSQLNPLEIKDAGFDYIFIDESHLLFQSEYRPVMSKVIDMIKNTEIPTILMTGTPVGETVFFPDITHLRVIKDDNRKKKFEIYINNDTDDLFLNMCDDMARDISQGKKVLYPTNKGTLYKESIKATVSQILESKYFYFNEPIVNYYKKSNVGEKFMDDINKLKTINDTDILMCSTYLSVGIDILDRYNFNIYFNDMWMPQEIEQFANRLRSNDLLIRFYISRCDSDGNPVMLHSYKNINLKLDDEELKACHSILQMCNSAIKRNPIEYKYNPLFQSILENNKFVEYNDIENKYYLNETSYKVIMFERKYRDFVCQLPVIAKGMIGYGYEYRAFQNEKCNLDDDVKSLVNINKKIKMEIQNDFNTLCIDELLELITEDRIDIYRDVLRGYYEIIKGSDWSNDLINKKMYVKSIEMFEKTIPIVISLSKFYTIADIREIFKFCFDGRYNFAAIKRIRLLSNILYNQKYNRLDIPVIEYLQAVYEFVNSHPKCKKTELSKFINDFALNNAKNESSEDVKIWLSDIVMKEIVDAYEKIFNCVVEKTRPSKGGIISLSLVKLMWKEKDKDYGENEKVTFMIEDFINSTLSTMSINID